MFEAVNKPLVDHQSLNIPDFKFGIIHCREFVDPNAPTVDPLHIHEQLEIFFNISADASFLVNDKIYPTSPFDVVVSCPHDVHVCIFNRPAIHEHFCLWIDGNFDSPMLDFLKRDSFYPLFSLDDKTKKQLRELFFSLHFAAENGSSALEQTALVLSILSILASSNGNADATSALPSQLQTIIDDIYENLSTINTVNEICQKHFVSSSTLTRWFRTYMHTSPHEYLQSQKCSHAARLLATGSNVTDACMRSGFSDCSHFIVLFKRKFGQTPLQYKRKF